MPRAAAIDTGIGEDSATLLAHLLATETATGADNAALLAHLTGRDDGLGSDSAGLRAYLAGMDTGIGADSATAVLKYYASGTDDGAGYDSAALLAHLAGSEFGQGYDTAALSAHLTGFDTGGGYDSATAVFSPHAPETQSWSAPGTITYNIPSWCRYIDIVLVGGGNGGGGGFAGFITGGGGNAGNWSHVTLERGVDIPWSATAITFVIPVATPGGTQGNKGAGGGAVTASVSGSSWAGLSATGGTGDQFGTTRNGQSPGTHTYNGQPYAGGAVQSTAQAAGNPPGGGGNGGNGNAFNGTKGGAGAPGGAWARAYQ
ncbi:glycine-rich domain-containing protein [Mycobacteroides abscessus]|uniref:glycine-rich domain-containing protein n=1 Tax=Mycobacteroides abscessus TaxID=36809 RepID=UPI002105A633|nr:hypothetical protein [Mycobacteroides abscessus]